MRCIPVPWHSAVARISPRGQARPRRFGAVRIKKSANHQDFDGRSVIHLDPKAIDQAFPFHFVLQESLASWGTIVAFGSRLSRVAPNVGEGRPFEDAFELEISGDHEAQPPTPDSLYLLRPTGREDDFRLRGQFLQLQSGPKWIFLGAPWVDDLADLERYGISLSDFPPHEALGDLLLLMTTRNLALRDQRDLTRQLRETASKLDERNQQLENELEQRERLETRLRKKQKMEALGLLAGGVAHDFNNLMTAILGYASLALASVDEKKPIYRWLTEVEKATKRASGLTAQLLTFSRQQVFQPRVVELEHECAEAESMLRRVLGENVTLVSDHSAIPNRIWIDPTALHQVIVNLVLNARDAMPTGGRVTIRTRTLAPNSDAPLPPEEGRFGSVLEVTDEGVGIPPDTMEKIFEPFFSNREGLQGTGLGLATVQGAVHQAEGEITIESVVGEGSSFRVWLPPCDGSVAERTSDSDDCGPVRLDGHALLVEDEEAVRNLLVLALTETGMELHHASNADEAETQAASIPELKLLITDVGLPGRSGPELATRVREIHPGVQVLFISGYAEDVAFRRAVGEGGHEFLQKPFLPQELIERIATLVNDP